MDKGAWWATVQGVAKSQTQLKRPNNKHTNNANNCRLLSANYVSDTLYMYYFLYFTDEITEDQRVSMVSSSW